MLTVIQWLHSIGVAFWVGGIFVNTLVVMPSMGVLSPPERGKLMGAFFKRFVPLSWGAIALVVITGLIWANSTIGFSGLVSFGTRYGNFLLVKIIVVLVLILNGTYMGFVLGPKIASFAPPPGAPEAAGPRRGERPPGPPPELARLQKRLTTLSWVQVFLALVVLFLMAQI